MARRVSTRFEKYWTESGRGDGQGDVEKKDHQLYGRPYMMGKARGKEEEEDYIKQIVLDVNVCNAGYYYINILGYKIYYHVHLRTHTHARTHTHSLAR